jgi:outer membrane biosynthesis protein TonB
MFAPATAHAQVNVTPNFSITPSSDTTSWIIWMALGAIILAVLVLIGVGVSYLRFAPKFFGREEAPKRPPPGARPPLLARTARTPAAVGAARPTVPTGPSTRTATAVAERPTPQPAPASAAAAPAPAATSTTAAVEPTAPPSGEPAVQADAVGEAEVRAPEPRPTAKTAEEVGTKPEETVAQTATTADQAAAEAAPAPAPAQPPSQGGGAAAMDQETFDRVLEEQLGKGVDRRVAEGRARAAAVVAARKKAAG